MLYALFIRTAYDGSDLHLFSTNPSHAPDPSIMVVQPFSVVTGYKAHQEPHVLPFPAIQNFYLPYQSYKLKSNQQSITRYSLDVYISSETAFGIFSLRLLPLLR